MDITKCTYKCPLNDRCKRFENCGINKYDNGNFCSYFAEIPYRIIDNTFECDMFWGEDSEYLLGTIKMILNAERS